jgi:hypothetical protein
VAPAVAPPRLLLLLVLLAAATALAPPAAARAAPRPLLVVVVAAAAALAALVMARGLAEWPQPLAARPLGWGCQQLQSATLQQRPALRPQQQLLLLLGWVTALARPQAVWALLLPVPR